MAKQRYCAWCKDPMGKEHETCPRCGARLCDGICLDAHAQAGCKKKER